MISLIRKNRSEKWHLQDYQTKHQNSCWISWGSAILQRYGTRKDSVEHNRQSYFFLIFIKLLRTLHIDIYLSLYTLLWWCTCLIKLKLRVHDHYLWNSYTTTITCQAYNLKILKQTQAKGSLLKTNASIYGIHPSLVTRHRCIDVDTSVYTCIWNIVHLYKKVYI